VASWRTRLVHPCAWILAGLFIAPKIYRLNLLTLGDYYRVRYNRAVEIFCSACIVVSYLGWVAAQISALGLIFNVLTDGAVSQEWGMVIGASVVLIYTLFGGMLSVAILDFIQMVVIAAGLVYIMWIVADLAGGVGTVVEHAEARANCSSSPKSSVMCCGCRSSAHS